MVRTNPKQPYDGLLAGHFAARFEEISQYSPEELILANFNAVQAMLAWEMDSHRTFEGEKATLLAALEVLVEQEQISAEYAAFVRTNLVGWNVERLVMIANQAQSLPVTALKLREEGDAQRQVKVLQQFLIDVLTLLDSREARTLGMQCITRLKVEAGLSQDHLNRMLALVEAGDRRRAEEEEDDTVDVDSEDIDAAEAEEE